MTAPFRRKENPMKCWNNWWPHFHFHYVLCVFLICISIFCTSRDTCRSSGFANQYLHLSSKQLANPSLWKHMRQLMLAPHTNTKTAVIKTQCLKVGARVVMVTILLEKSTSAAKTREFYGDAESFFWCMVHLGWPYPTSEAWPWGPFGGDCRVPQFRAISMVVTQGGTNLRIFFSFSQKAKDFANNPILWAHPCFAGCGSIFFRTDVSPPS